MVFEFLFRFFYSVLSLTIFKYITLLCCIYTLHIQQLYSLCMCTYNVTVRAQTRYWCTRTHSHNNNNNRAVSYHVKAPSARPIRFPTTPSLFRTLTSSSSFPLLWS